MENIVCCPQPYVENVWKTFFEHVKLMLDVRCFALLDYENSSIERIFFGKSYFKELFTPLILIVSKIFLCRMLITSPVENCYLLYIGAIYKRLIMN